MDSISDAISTAEEIQDAIATGVPHADYDELNKDLEAELDAILTGGKDEAESTLGGLPEVPTEEPEADTVAAASINGADFLASRLKRLREAA